MKARKTSHPCFCMFIPPHVLDRLSNSSDPAISEETREAARNTLSQDDAMRANRAAQATETAMSEEGIEGVTAPPQGTASREVYSCNFQEAEPPPFELLRGEDDPLAQDEVVNLAYDHAGAVRDYYKNVLGRNSIDDLGMNQIHRVHFGTQYMNAFWDGTQMTYGDGDDVTFINFTRDPDVVAHELTHGVTQHTSNLTYFGQSGALNEHFSDVFGSVIQQAIAGQTAHDANWLIGDEIMGPAMAGEALRSMKAPGTAYDNDWLGKDPQPAHMRDFIFTHEDNEGVHLNSGIPNKVFYLVAMDIGTDKAALIWYTVLKELPADANFGDYARWLANVARRLTMNGQTPSGSPQAVRLALREVGLYP